MIMFEHQRSWIAHEMEHHRRQWSCQLCGFTSLTESSLAVHLKQDHDQLLGAEDKEAPIQANSRPLDYIDASECMLCDWAKTVSSKNSTTLVTLHVFMDHVASHLRQFALFALPRPHNDGHSESLGSNCAEGQGSRKSSSSDLKRLTQGTNLGLNSPRFGSQAGTHMVNNAENYQRESLPEGASHEKSLETIKEVFQDVSRDLDAVLAWEDVTSDGAPYEYLDEHSHSPSRRERHDPIENDGRSHILSSEVIRSKDVVLSGGATDVEAPRKNTDAYAKSSTRYGDYMKSLYHPEMFQRQESVQPPSFNTFEWIFNDPMAKEADTQTLHQSDPTRGQPSDDLHGRFMRWLCSDATLFWIFGKPGSGKSSLISHINQSPNTVSALSSSAWTGHRPLHILSFYFWHPGIPLQKSFHGLLRSLIFQLGKAKLEAIEYMMSAEPGPHKSWTIESLLRAFQASLAAFSDDSFLLLVDGLDECESDIGEVLDFILDLRQRIHAKVCIASRYEVSIAYKLSIYPKLRLDDINGEDIEAYVRRKTSTYRSLIPEEMVGEVIRRADGCFLWAQLMTVELLKCAYSGDGTDVLRRRMDNTPAGLEAFAQSIGDRGRQYE